MAGSVMKAGRIQQILKNRYRSRMRYRLAQSWAKPMVNPWRFLRNQTRKCLLKFEEPSTSRVDAFHLDDFKIVDGEWVSEEIAGYGVYEPDLTWILMQLVKEGDVVMDVGMHLGYYATLFALLTGEGGQVHAFEPTPMTRALAAANTERFPQIHVRHEALWSDHGTIVLRDYGLKWMAFNGAKGAKLAVDFADGVDVEVNCLTLDQLWEELRTRIQLVKIDAESAELEILKGGRRLLQEVRPLLSMEVGDAAEQGTSREALNFALEQGYEAWEICGEKLARHKAQESYRYGNLILAPTGWEPPC
ncbi:MAG: FkbM family methyltransferase [Verrucomicrobia bacterium]|nr:FkbM family methyltransferase [Verrucomicrobiota bacterium]